MVEMELFIRIIKLLFRIWTIKRNFPSVVMSTNKAMKWLTSFALQPIFTLRNYGLAKRVEEILFKYC